MRDSLELVVDEEEISGSEKHMEGDGTMSLVCPPIQLLIVVKC